MHWKKTFAKHTSGKELFSKIHHKSLNLAIKRQTHSLKKNAGGKAQLTEADVHMANTPNAISLG